MTIVSPVRHGMAEDAAVPTFGKDVVDMAVDKGLILFC